MFLEFKKTPLYANPSGAWAFVQKENHYRTLNDFLTCKDYIHEMIASRVHNRSFITAGTPSYKKINLDKFLMVLSFNSSYKNIKKAIFLTMAFIQRYESYANIPLTKFKELQVKEETSKKGFEHTKYFLIDADVTYVKSPVLMHWMIATLRTMPLSKSLLSYDFDFDKIYENILNGDAIILKYMYKHDIVSKLMKNPHNLNLNEVYPLHVDKGTYHSNFGIVAACKNKLGAPKYREYVQEVFKKENIPYI